MHIKFSMYIHCTYAVHGHMFFGIIHTWLMACTLVDRGHACDVTIDLCTCVTTSAILEDKKHVYM